jgi:hypothetical protein
MSRPLIVSTVSRLAYGLTVAAAFVTILRGHIGAAAPRRQVDHERASLRPHPISAADREKEPSSAGKPHI